MLKTFVDWVTWGALVLPLAAVAWSAVSYVLLQQQLRRDKQYMRFFECMEQIGRENYSIAAKMAAVSELKKYHQHYDVIVVFSYCNDFTISMIFYQSRHSSIRFY